MGHMKYKNDLTKLLVKGLLGCVCSLVMIVSFGFITSLRWATDPGMERNYKEKIHEKWKTWDTPKLIKKFKKRILERSETILQIFYPIYPIQPVRYSADYSVLLDLLKARKDDPGVYECFLDAIRNPSFESRSNDLIKALWLYETKNKRIENLFVSLCLNPRTSNMVKIDVIELFNKNNVVRSDLLPTIKLFFETLPPDVEYYRRGEWEGIAEDMANYANKLGFLVVHNTDNTATFLPINSKSITPKDVTR